MVHKSINDSKLKKFDLNNTIGFSLGVSLILYNDILYVANVKSFETFFRMSEYYKTESENIIDTVLQGSKIQEDTLVGLRTVTRKDSVIAKSVSKLKFRAERVNKLFDALNDTVFKTVMSDKVFINSFHHVMFENDLLKVKDPTDKKQIKELIRFIADTAQKSPITDESSVGKF
ncbi:Kiwa anti-phage protein KwaB-like domain-containing protein [Lacticaseibacillus pantheris]|uniref:Kiwa anti-phage protein KwaB-like domain-containing protein n=1 Tax=Lacticaseibacillus pantheris TaxID=171523 RepID=UPI003F6E5061